MSGSEDSAQDADIVELVNAFNALDILVAQLQTDVAAIQQQLIDGPPQFGNWEIPGAADAAAQVEQMIANIVSGASTPPAPTPTPPPPVVPPPVVPPPVVPPPVVPPPVVPPPVVPPPVVPPPVVPPPVVPPPVVPPPVVPPPVVPPPVVPPPVVPPPAPPPPPTAGPGTNFFLSGATDSSFDVNINAPGPNMSQYTVQIRRTIDFTWNEARFASDQPVIKQTISGFPPNTLFSVRMSANGSAFTYILLVATTGSSGDSPDGSFTTNAGDAFTAQGGHVWSFAETSSPMQIIVDGVADDTTSRVVTMVYSGGKVYQENCDLNWWFKTLPTDTWTPTTDPRIGVPAITPIGTTFITENAPNPGVVMNFQYNIPLEPQITFVFWGPDWAINAQRPEDIITKMNNVYPTAYFRGLSEYFCNTVPVIVDWMIVNSQPPFFTTLPPVNNPNVIGGVDSNGAYTALTEFCAQCIDNGTLPMPTSNNTMYFFVLPNSAGNPPGAGGFHGGFNHRGVQIPVGIVFGFNDINQYTLGITHETVEAMTDRDVDGFVNGHNLLGTWSGPGQGSIPGNIIPDELEDFGNQTFPFANGTQVAGYWMNRLGKLGFTT